MLNSSKTSLFVAFLIGLVYTSCNDPIKPDTQLPKLFLYPVKESKTLIFENDKVVDSAKFQLTFDLQGQLMSQESFNDDAILKIDYSNPTLYWMKQYVKSTGKLMAITRYTINSKGQAIYKTTFDADSNIVGKSTLVYNSNGYNIQEYVHGIKDSILVLNSNWQNDCLTLITRPQNEISIASDYTKYPDIRNLGFSQFLRDKSYYLVEKQKITTRGNTDIYNYSYAFDSLRRPVVITIYRNSIKLQEKHYTYW